MRITLLTLINILSSSVLGDLRLIVKTLNTGSSTILLTELVSPGILRAEESKRECAALRTCTTEPVALKINRDNTGNQCFYDESVNTSCSYRFRLQAVNGDYSIDATLTGEYFGHRIEFKANCSVGKNSPLGNKPETQTYQTIQLTSSAKNLEGSPTYGILEERDGRIIRNDDWTDSWSTSIDRVKSPTADSLSTSHSPTTTTTSQLLTTTDEVSTTDNKPTISSDSLSTSHSPTTTTISQLLTTTDEVSTTDNKPTISSEHTLHSTGHVGVSQQEVVARENRTSAELKIYILSSSVGLLAVVVIAALIFIIRLKRNFEARKHTSCSDQKYSSTAKEDNPQGGIYEDLKMDNCENVNTYEQVQTQQNISYEVSKFAGF